MLFNNINMREMKNFRFLFVLFSLLLFAADSVDGQTILKGDMNNDEQVTIADVTSLVNVILGKAPQETINVGVSPYMVDNSMVVGTWYAPDGAHFTLNEDGTTDFTGAATYKFRPYQGTLMFFDVSGKFVKTLMLYEVEKTYLLAVTNLSGTSYTYYTNSASLVTGLAMSEVSLTMNSGTSTQLSVTASPANAFNVDVTWSSSNTNVATVDASGIVTAVAGGTCTITAKAADGSGKVATCEVTVIQMVTDIQLSSTSLVLYKDSYQKLTATVLPSDAANTKVVWSSSDDSVAEVTSTGGVVAVGLGTCTITCEATDGSGVMVPCLIRVIDINERMFVDLGLPSGTLWATCNIGATNPEDYGDYFAWGETEGYDSGKTTFDWSTYKWCEGSYKTLTKYCTNSSYGYNGFTDNKTELDLEDDAAYVNCGPDWRMPSYEQLKELINSSYTTTEWTTLNGVNGRKITSKKTGNSIFLPAAGGRSSSSLYLDGSGGTYWSRTLNSDYPYYARDLHFDSSGISTYYDSRCFGRSVRPVCSPE